MEDKSSIANLLKRVLLQTETGKISWQVNPSKDGFISYLESYSLEVNPPSDPSIRMLIDMSNILPQKQLIYQPLSTEIRLIVKNLKSGNVSFEVGPSFFSLQDQIAHDVNSETFRKLADAIKTQFALRRSKEAETVLEELDEF